MGYSTRSCRGGYHWATNTTLREILKLNSPSVKTKCILKPSFFFSRKVGYQNLSLINSNDRKTFKPEKTEKEGLDGGTFIQCYWLFFSFKEFSSFNGNAFKQRFVKQKIWKMHNEFKRKEKDFCPIAARINRGWHANFLSLCSVLSQPASHHLRLCCYSSALFCSDQCWWPGRWGLRRPLGLSCRPRNDHRCVISLLQYRCLHRSVLRVWKHQAPSAQTRTTLHAGSVPRSKPLRQPEASGSTPWFRWFKDCLT